VEYSIVSAVSFEQANEVIGLDHLVSFTGIVTFKNGTDVRNVAAQIPIWKFMVETDCPYLAPVPFRGKRCEPAHTRLVAESIATARGILLEDLADMTTQTAEKFFRFNDEDRQSQDRPLHSRNLSRRSCGCDRVLRPRPIPGITLLSARVNKN